MDSDLPKAVEDELRNLVDLVSQQTSIMSGMSRSIAEITGSVNNVSSVANTQSNNQTKNASAVNQNAASQTALSKINERYRDATNQAIENFTAAGFAGKNAFLSFATTVLSTQEGFAKYNNVIGGLGDAALSLGRNFGILGTIVGGLLKGASAVLQYQTQQADSIFKAYDDVARLGTAGTISTKEIMDMGRGAGLTSMTLENLTEPMKSVRGGFIALGGTQSRGIKIFGEATAVSVKVRKEFQRLGMGDRDRNQAIADFMSMMNTTGMAFTTEMQSAEGLQKAALAYTRQMYVLAEVSGLTVEEAKKKYELQMATDENALFESQLKKDIMDAEKAITNAKTAGEREAANARLEQLKQKDAGYKALNQEMMSANLSQDQIIGMQRRFFTGFADKYSTQLDAQGVPVEMLLAKARKNQLTPGEAKKELTNNFNKALANFGQENVLLDQESAKNLGFNIEQIVHATQTAQTDYEKQFKNANDKIQANAQGKGPVATDPAQIARNELTEKERWLRQKIDDLALEFNPFLGNGGKLLASLEVAAKGALAVILLIAAFKAGKGIYKGGKGLVNKMRGTGAAGAVATTAASKAAPATATTDIAADVAAGAGASKAKAAEDAVTKGMQVATDPKIGKIVSFMFAPVRGLAALGRMMVPIVMGSTKIGLAIVAIGAAIAAASVAISKGAIPYISKGLYIYDFIDGPAIEVYGKAMQSLAFGISNAVAGSFTGNLAKVKSFFTGMFSSDIDPLEVMSKQILLVQNLDFNKKQLLVNTDALVAFSSMMVGGMQKTAKMASATAMQNTSDAVSSFFSNELPTEQFVRFSKIQVDSKAVKNNSKAFKLFAEAVSSYEGIGSSVGVMGSAIAQSTASFFGEVPPLEQFVYFSQLDMNARRTLNNATAFRLFSQAMSSYKGMGSGLSGVSQAIGEAVFRFYRGKPPINKFKNFADIDVDQKEIEDKTNAFVNFLEALSSYKPAGALDTIGNFLTGGNSYFSKGGAVYMFEEFAKMNFVKDKKTGKADAGLLGEYATSIGTEAFVGEDSPLDETINNVVDDTKSFVGDVVEWAGKTLDAAILKLKPKNITLGPKASLDNVDLDLIRRFFTASAAYGKPVTISSGYRPDEYQAQLWVRGRVLHEPGIYKPSKPKNSQVITYKGKQYSVPGSGRGSPHLSGRALDVTPSTGYGNFDPYLHKYGLNRPVSGDPPHVQKARDGGVFSGPGSGYPVELHGSEIVVPLNPNSLLMRLSQIPYDTVEPETLAGLIDSPQNSINFDLYNKIASQLDTLYSVIDDTHDIDKKMLKQELF